MIENYVLAIGILAYFVKFKLKNR